MILAWHLINDANFYLLNEPMPFFVAQKNKQRQMIQFTRESEVFKFNSGSVDNSIFEQPIILHALQPTGSFASQTEE